MTDPKLKRTTVEVSFSCDDGYIAEKKFISRKSPEQGMIAAIRELSRMAHLYGYGKEAGEAFNEAKQAIKKFHDNRE